MSEERVTATTPGQLAAEIALIHLKGIKLRYVHRQSRVLYEGARKNPLFDGEEAKAVRVNHGPPATPEYDELERLTNQLRKEAGIPMTHSNNKPIETQFRTAIDRVGDRLCIYGWRCWEHNSCGGIFGPTEGLNHGNFLHRLPLFPYDPIQLGQFTVCVSFLRKCEPSDQHCEIGRLLRPLDEFVRTGMTHHSCLRASPAREDEIDEAANEFVHECQNGGEPQALVIHKGILIAAAVYHGFVRGDAIEREPGPELPVFLKPAKGDTYSRGRAGTLSFSTSDSCLVQSASMSAPGSHSGSYLSPPAQNAIPTEPVLTRSGSILTLRKVSNSPVPELLSSGSPPLSPIITSTPPLQVGSPIMLTVKKVSATGNRNSLRGGAGN